MKAISLNDGTQLDLDTTEGRYRYVAHFLNQHGAHPEIWSALSSLYEAANATGERPETRSEDA